MPDLSPEPKMMRSQQDKDTPETLSDDETRATEVRKDVDGASGRDREKSKEGEARYETEQMDAIFEGNKRGDEDASEHSERATAEQTATEGTSGLANKGRSRLGD